MTGTETSVVRMDGDNKPVRVCLLTGSVDRPNTYYPAKLRGEAAVRLFLAGVGIVLSHEVAGFIQGCNRAAARKTLATDAARLDAAYRAAGLPMLGHAADVKSAKPHPASCPCPRCAIAHARQGCRRINCPACG